MFDQAELYALPPPDHLRQLPDAVVGHLAAIVMSEFPVLHLTLQQELRAAMETRTAHDWQRVANALRHAYGRPGLAQEIEDALSVD
jgi:hypothetical protein